MEKWIILTTNTLEDLEPINPIYDVETIAFCGDNGELLVFDSLEEAHQCQEEYSVNGICVELPLY